MTFHLENLLPTPLEELDVSSSQVWRKTLSLPAGKCVRLQAASGKGKTTLLHILYGRRQDYKGSASTNGKSLESFNSGKWALFRQKEISIVFQELMLFGELTGEENILLKNKLTNHYPKETIRQMAERINSGHLLKKRCGIMSFGERQRIAIVRSLVQPFSWILLDEPFSHLDDANANLASAMIAEECKKRNAGILITALGADDFFTYDETLMV